MFAVAVLGIFMSFVDTVRPIENPYLTISKRNAFDLTGEPPPAPKTAPEPPKSEDIKLTGIYRQEGVERAALALIDTKKKAAEPPKYLQLAAGEKKDGIEIVPLEHVHEIEVCGAWLAVLGLDHPHAANEPRAGDVAHAHDAGVIAIEDRA